VYFCFTWPHVSFSAASQTVRKIIEINPYMLGTMAGGAADCQFWHRNLGVKVKISFASLLAFHLCIVGLTRGSFFSAGSMSSRTSEGSLLLVLQRHWPISFIHIVGWVFQSVQWLLDLMKQWVVLWQI
jgi:hypothetical protein